MSCFLFGAGSSWSTWVKALRRSPLKGALARGWDSPISADSDLVVFWLELTFRDDAGDLGPENVDQRGLPWVDRSHVESERPQRSRHLAATEA